MLIRRLGQFAAVSATVYAGKKAYERYQDKPRVVTHIKTIPVEKISPSPLLFFQPKQAFESKNEFEIGPLTSLEFEQLSQVAKQTYASTYPSFFSEQELEDMFGKHYIEKQLPSEMRNPDIQYIAYRHNNELIGYAKLIFHNDYAELNKLYLLDCYHGRGHGSDLLYYCFNKAVEHGYEKMVLRAYNKNSHAINFYERNGFHETNIIPYIPPDGSKSYEYDLVMECTELKSRLCYKSKACHA